jgi:hypothetical protein
VATDVSFLARDGVEDVRASAEQGASNKRGCTADEMNHSGAGKVVESGVLQPALGTPRPVAACGVDEAFNKVTSDISSSGRSYNMYLQPPILGHSHAEKWRIYDLALILI